MPPYQLMLERANAEAVLLGVKIAHCAYAGNMEHESGLSFIPVPSSFSLEDFRDDEGKMPVLRGIAA